MLEAAVQEPLPWALVKEVPEPLPWAPVKEVPWAPGQQQPVKGAPWAPEQQQPVREVPWAPEQQQAPVQQQVPVQTELKTVLEHPAAAWALGNPAEATRALICPSWAPAGEE